jgi:hypothetical protein
MAKFIAVAVLALAATVRGARAAQAARGGFVRSLRASLLRHRAGPRRVRAPGRAGGLAAAAALAKWAARAPGGPHKRAFPLALR